MKTYLYYLSIFTTLFACPVFADDINTNDWGALVNNVQMSIGLADDKQEITNNQPVILLIRFRDVSTNESFHIYSMNTIQGDPQFSYVVISPSGKNISPKMDSSPTGSGQFIRITPNKVVKRRFDLSRVCKFNEIGIYKIVAKRWVNSTVDQKAYLLVSNPLNVPIVQASNKLNSTRQP